MWAYSASKISQMNVVSAHRFWDVKALSITWDCDILSGVQPQKILCLWPAI